MATRYLQGTRLNDLLKARNDGATHFIKGYSGDDLLIGGFGNDRLDGGKGFDKAIFGNADNRIDLRSTRAQYTGEGFDP